MSAGGTSTLIVGASGSGKSVAAMRTGERIAPAIAYVPDVYPGDFPTWPRMTAVEWAQSEKRLPRAILDDELEEVVDLVWLFKQARAYVLRWVFFDEADIFVKRDPERADYLARRHRHFGAHILWATQRPTSMADLASCATWIRIHQLVPTNAHDLRWADSWDDPRRRVTSGPRAMPAWTHGRRLSEIVTDPAHCHSSIVIERARRIIGYDACGCSARRKSAR